MSLTLILLGAWITPGVLIAGGVLVKAYGPGSRTEEAR